MRVPSPLPLLLVLAGCAYGRVTLPAPPPPGATEAERRQAFDELAPVGQQESLQYLHSALTVPAAEDDAWLLGNGTRVSDPRDLLGVVKPGSTTARHAAAFVPLYERSRWALLGGTVGVGLGAGLCALGVSRGEPAGLGPPEGLPWMAAGGAVLAAALGTVLWGVAEWLLAGQSRSAAFAAYPHDLQRRLWFEKGLGGESEVAAPAAPP